MLYFLVLLEDPKFLQILSFFLEGCFGLKVKCFASNEIFNRFINKNTDIIHGVIFDYLYSALEVVPSLLKKEMEIHFFSGYSEIPTAEMCFEKEKYFHFFKMENIFEELNKIIPDIFTSLKTEVALFAMGNIFFPIDVNLLLNSNPLKAPVYIKLSELKYVKILNEGHVFDEKNYQYFFDQKKIHTLYIQRNYCFPFTLMMQENLKIAIAKARIESLKLKAMEAQVLEKEYYDDLKKESKQAEQEKEAEQEKLAQTLEKSLLSELSSMHNLVNHFGLTKEAQNLTRKNVSSTIRIVRNSPKLSDLLKRLSQEKGQYISTHSMLVAYIACAIATQMEWTSDTTYHKLTLSAFLHDITLKNDSLAAIENLFQLMQNNIRFTAQEIKDYKEHPIAAAELARKLEEVPPDVDLIIVQHHERPDGSGFPRSLMHTHIAPLAVVFIIAHDFVSFLYQLGVLNSDSKNPAISSSSYLGKFVEAYSQVYQFGNFKKVMGVIQKIQM